MIGEDGGHDVEDGEEETPMEGAEAKKFRGIAARANYLGLDRPDIQYTTKEVCRNMSKPKKRHWRKLKRLARYLVMYPRLIWKFEDDGRAREDWLDVFSDSDWAGDKESRKSTSPGMASLGGGLLKSWSSTQGSIAMSSGEAEYYALVNAAAEGLGVQALAKDLGISMKIRLWVDSTSAKAIVARIGLGKVRHMEVKYLWAQQAFKEGRFEVRKISGLVNPADIGTKPLSAADMKTLIEKVGGRLVRKAGRSPSENTVGETKRKSWADEVDSDPDE